MAACDDDTGTPAAVDMSVIADMASKADAGGISCSGIISCANACTNPAMLVQCTQACAAQGTSGAQTKFGALSTCLQQHCLDPDMGAVCLMPSSQACLACATTNCGTQLNACAMDM